MPYHLAAHAVPGALAFCTWAEALALWRRVVAALSSHTALTLMPDHLHALTERDEHRRLGDALGAYARWRNHRHGRRGPLWSRQPPPVLVTSAQKIRRTERYIHLNPCRAHLVDDPLAWPFSSYRDRVGLAPFPIIRAVPDPYAFHAWVSGMAPRRGARPSPARTASPRPIRCWRQSAR